MLSKPHAITSDGKFCVVDDEQWKHLKALGVTDRGPGRCACGGPDPIGRALPDTAKIKAGIPLGCSSKHPVYALTPYVAAHWEASSLTPEVKPAGWHDPRILVISYDGKRCALLCSDVPEGVQRSSGKEYRIEGKDVVAMAMVKSDLTIDYAVGPKSNGTSKSEQYVVLVYTADLPPSWFGDKVRSAAPAPVKKIIPDWPLACPKCQRGQSAVLLFQGYDCKHGCYK